MLQKIFFNGNILTQDKKNPVATAFCVNENKIAAVGNDEIILSKKTSSSEIIDLKGKTVLPGFYDAHIHLWKVGDLMTYILDLRGVKSIDEMMQMLLDFSKKNRERKWIVARGFNEALFHDKRIPTRFDIDKVIPDKPVCIIRTCAHQIAANTMALAICNIDENTKTPIGGEIKKDNSGKPNGHFTETAIGLVMNHIPRYTIEEYKNVICAAQNEMLKLGITSVCDPAVTPDLLEVYKSMERNGELKIHVNAIPTRVPDGGNEVLPLPEKYHSDFLNVNAVKFFADGGLSGKTAAMKSFYKNTNERGVLRLTENFFFPLAKEAQDAGFKIATHAIGDLAMEVVLNVYKKLNQNNPLKIRHRIEHVGFANEDQLQQMHDEKISAVMQPIFLYELGKNFRQYLSDDYLGKVYPCNSILKNKINLALSTDAPVVKNINPFLNMQSAVLRKDSEGNVIGETEKISFQNSIFAYTMGSAIACDEQDEKGSISEGKLADFIILNRSPLKMHGADIYELKAEEVFVNGNHSSAF
jgi:predicted amidohydrolase YtcJ